MFTITSSADTIATGVAGGHDKVISSIDYTLTGNLQDLTLTGSATHGTGNDLGNLLTANNLGDTLTGGAGNDRLFGGTGIDTLIGGGGNDVYEVHNSATKIVEKANGGGDLVHAYVDYVLPDNVESISLEGSATHATGNDLSNVIYSNSLVDVLTGGKGNDTYYVNNSADTVVENAGGGYDWIVASVDYTAPANVESLKLTGTATHATANDQGMILTGNDLGDVLTGGKGNDTIIGGKGNDTIIGGAGNDRLTGGGGHDTFVFATGFGRDTITDFDLVNDKIDWSALSAQHMAPKMQDSGANVIVSFGSDNITLLGLHAADLSAHHVFG